MGLSSLCLITVSIYILSTIVLFHLVVANSLQSYNTPTCHDDEIYALLQFKQSFVIRKSASVDKGAYPKISSWKSNSSCCSWDGVECDEKTGHVIGLDLSSSCLYGSFSSNNTLFSLVHLQHLNLADNHFIGSQIPTSIGKFPRLSLAQNLTGLQTLDLSSINISSTIPDTLTNLSRLTSLTLADCGLFGKLSGRIFKLKNLKVLDVSNNPALTGYFPDDYSGSSPNLMSLKLSATNFFINLPSLIERFHSLKELAVSSCNISEGPVPFSLGNLRDLIYLDLSHNKFNGQVPFSLGNLRDLIYLDLSYNKFNGQSYNTPTCRDDEIYALLQFKQSFIIDMSASVDKGAYPKISSWKSNSSCCSWDGIECDEKTGHVIGLNLNSSCLYGSFSSNNTLFSLVHLQRLNLADNDFNFSQIPTSIRNFPRLRYLNLSYSVFSGHVPSEVLQLSKLSSLDLSRNEDIFFNEELLRSLPQNLTGLQTLDLSSINISSTVPNTLTNLSLLTSLILDNCGLSGKSLGRIFKLKNLKVLSVRYNPTLTGYFPDDYNGSSPDLMSLKLSATNFSINLPSLIERFHSLKELDLSSCNISEGPVPFSLGNLRDLIYLDLSHNNFNGQIPTATLVNLTQLTYLSLSYNYFHGSVPWSLFNLMNLQTVYLDHNNLSGTVEFQKFLNLQKLTSLDLSNNNLELLAESRFLNNATTVLPKFEYLGLGECNIREFPDFLRSQDVLSYLDLSGNKLQGQVPKWMRNISTQTLFYINISHNLLSGFEKSPAVLPWLYLGYLDLSFNMFRELLLLPLTSFRYYNIANNKLTGRVSPMICNMTSLGYLDLSNNKLIGNLPQCGGNFGAGLEYLKLGNNSFHGNLPQSYTNGRNLRMIDIGHNNFHGQLPRSLANCASLEILVLSHNNFSDTFPVWLGALPELKILTMDHNVFYGVIVKPNKKNLQFPMLRILDLSYNNFSGQFPFEYIFSGNGTTSITHDLEYYHIYESFIEYYSYSITIICKGVERYYPRVREDLILIDISSNNFEGKIPEFIGKLEGIWSLNLSNNILTGRIRSSLSNLSRLESLDISHNKLSGEIPQQLAQLDSLSKFNVSHNNLTGPVPRGIHFTTFDSTSYQGNQGLCGDFLPKKCGNSEGTQLPPSTSEDNDSGSGIELDWKFVVAGSGSGLLVGVVLADFVITKWNVWFIEIVAIGANYGVVSSPKIAFKTFITIPKLVQNHEYRFGAAPNVFGCNILIKRNDLETAHQGKLVEAIKVMDEMEDNGVGANEVTYGVMIEACCKEKKSGCLPNKSTYAMLIEGLCDSGEEAEMARVISMANWQCQVETNIDSDSWDLFLSKVVGDLHTAGEC
ncbi:receptor-like protein 6 [Rosa rugosa]|uniref:receptor-like protein 6 n=1 Tax=Rosa rugosa TaxID=74645 RepID=UPI002B40DF78|nr:receptor-like protein 6 [Rosa rugosa]